MIEGITAYAAAYSQYLAVIRTHFDALAAEGVAAAGDTSARAPAGHVAARINCYAANLDRLAGQLNDLYIAYRWLVAGIPVEDAATWANRGYLPGEAAPLIADGVPPAMDEAVTESPAIDGDGRGAGDLRAVVERLTERIPGLILDPELADRLDRDELSGLRPEAAVHYEVLNVDMAHPRYEELVGQLRQPQLTATMWADAEHRLVEQPGKVWTIVAVREHGQWTPAAWAAATVESNADRPVLQCSDNYERRGAGREHHLYTVAYRHRHATVVKPSNLPALTYLFAQPIALHEADGWYRTGVCGTSDDANEPHDWWELRRAG